jgi:hypothetical protein
MGAVFALFSAWYFWIPKMLGLDYNKMLGKVHFWIFFAGVNITFFPQHFLGLQGMPRRISDYPDAFAGWNLISSYGSIVSVVATFLFLHMVYLQLVHGKATTRYPWLIPQFYSDTLQVLQNRSYPSLEWGLSSPPKPHAFVSLPLQSFFCSPVSGLPAPGGGSYSHVWRFIIMEQRLDVQRIWESQNFNRNTVSEHTQWISTLERHKRSHLASGNTQGVTDTDAMIDLSRQTIDLALARIQELNVDYITIFNSVFGG